MAQAGDGRGPVERAVGTADCAPVLVSIGFSKPVSGLTLAEITVTGGTATMLSGAGATCEVSVIASGQGDVTVSILAEVAQSALGAGNLASGVRLTPQVGLSGRFEF